MIRDILLLKPYLSSYYEATKLIIEKQPIENEPVEESEEQEHRKVFDNMFSTANLYNSACSCAAIPIRICPIYIKKILIIEITIKLE
jgi:hypothetical protein